MNYYTNLSTTLIDLELLENSNDITINNIYNLKRLENSNNITINDIYLGHFIKKFKNYYLFLYTTHCIDIDIEYNLFNKYINKYKSSSIFLKNNIKNIPYPNEVCAIKKFLNNHYISTLHNIFHAECLYYMNRNKLELNKSKNSYIITFVLVNRVYFK